MRGQSTHLNSVTSDHSRDQLGLRSPPCEFLSPSLLQPLLYSLHVLRLATTAAIPAAPAGIGTLQYAFHIAAILFDFSPSAALVAATIVQLALLGSATVVGAMVYSYAVYNHLMRADEATT